MNPEQNNNLRRLGDANNPVIIEDSEGEEEEREAEGIPMNVEQREPVAVEQEDPDHYDVDAMLAPYNFNEEDERRLRTGLEHYIAGIRENGAPPPGEPRPLIVMITAVRLAAEYGFPFFMGDNLAELIQREAEREEQERAREQRMRDRRIRRRREQHRQAQERNRNRRVYDTDTDTDADVGEEMDHSSDEEDN